MKLIPLIAFLLSGCYIERGDRRDTAPAGITINVSSDQMSKLREELLK